MNQDWTSKRLGEVAILQRGYDLPGRLRKAGAVPIVSSSGITDTHAEAKVAGPGVVTGRYGTIGSVFFIQEDYWPLNTTLYVRDFCGNDPQYISYVLRTIDFDAYSGKSGVPGVNRNDLHEIEMVVPPLAEQRAIAEALSDMDALIAALDALVDKKRAVKTATMQQLLTGRQRLPGFSREWSPVSLSEIGTFSKGKGIRKDEVAAGGLPCVRYGELYTKHVDVIRDFASHIPLAVAAVAQPIRQGDILFAGSGETKADIGMAAAYLGDHEAYAGGDIVILSPNPRVADSAFLGYLLNTPRIAVQKASRAQGDAVVHISAASLGQITFDLPSRSEQTAIAAVFSDMDAEIAALEARRDKTAAIKTGMMQELLTGRTRLVQLSAPPPPVQQVPARPAKERGHNWAIDNAVVLGCLAERFGTPARPLARVRRTKLTYLLRRHTGKAPKGFLKQAAGPYDPKVRYGGPEQIAQKNGYVRESDAGGYKGFVAAGNAEKARGYFESWYGTEELDWLEQFRHRTKDELGALTTVDYAALELRRAGRDVTVEAVKSVLAADAAWAPKLDQPAFRDDKIEAAIQMSSELFGTALPDDH